MPFDMTKTVDQSPELNMSGYDPTNGFAYERQQAQKQWDAAAPQRKADNEKLYTEIAAQTKADAKAQAITLGVEIAGAVVALAVVAVLVRRFARRATVAALTVGVKAHRAGASLMDEARRAA